MSTKEVLAVMKIAREIEDMAHGDSTLIHLASELRAITAQGERDKWESFNRDYSRYMDKELK